MENISPFLASLLGNIVVGTGIFFIILFIKFIKNKFLHYMDYITAITVGLLLSIIFLGFLPKIVKSGIEANSIGIFILLGIFLFYILELFLHWHHCKDLGHSHSCKTHQHHKEEHEKGILMFGGTMLHNAFHGVVLFVAFSSSLSFGIATTTAILLHSIPQNIVNYIMNHKKTKYAYIGAFGGVFGSILVFPFSEFFIINKAYVLAIISGGLLYTALADIFPEFKGKGTTSKKFIYLFFIIIGIFSFIGFEKFSELIK